MTAKSGFNTTLFLLVFSFAQVYGIVPEAIEFPKTKSRGNAQIDSSIKIDGNLSPMELKNAKSQKMKGGGSVFFKEVNSQLYVGIRGIKPGISHICLTDGENVYILHASGALGTAIFKKDTENWSLTKNFKWELRSTKLDPESNKARNDFFKKNGWIANVGGMGSASEMEYLISEKYAMSGSFSDRKTFRFAAAYASGPKSILYFPTGLRDDSNLVKLVSGDPPKKLNFDPLSWAEVSFPSQKTTSLAKDRNDLYQVKIHPGAELITIMLWMAGKYPLPMDSKYKSDVWEHFKKHREHPSLARLKKAKIYPDFTENGLLLSGFPNVKVDIPNENSWYKITGKNEVIGILKDALEFAKDTGFWEFFKANRKTYSKMTNGLSHRLAEEQTFSKLKSFYGPSGNRQKTLTTIYLEPLNYWGAHAINFKRLTGRARIGNAAFQIGPARKQIQFPDSTLRFTLNRSSTKTIWHESSHLFLKSSIAKYEKEISRLSALFNPADLKSQNITTWKYAFEENLIRAIVAVLAKQELGEDEYKKEIASQTRRGFIYSKPISKMIVSKFIENRDSFKTFDDFIPRIISGLKRT